MRHLIFSDIHSNLEALEAVIESSADKSVDSIFCLGDFVGYGADPDECVKRVRSLSGVEAVLGNHDAAVIDASQRDLFNPVAHAGIIYSEQNIEQDSLDYLKKLPLVIDSRSDFMLVHASPYRPDGWVYILESIEAADAFQAMQHPLAFIGHTHTPVVHTDDGMPHHFVPGERVTIEPGRKYIINVGSVGQPRDGDPRAAYVIFDDESRTVEIFRVEYDIDRATEKIFEAGLPPILAHRLRRGF